MAVEGHSLFISPHLDDVVLSCALGLQLQQKQHRQISIATVFSKGWTKPDGTDLYSGRRTEDKAALSCFGPADPANTVDPSIHTLDAIHLGFPDAPIRRKFYDSVEKLLLERDAEDVEFSHSVSEAVRLLYEELKPDTIFFPLSVGTHIDHRLTHETWKSIPAAASIVFYEDRPYCFLPFNLICRLWEIGVDVENLGMKPENASHFDVVRAIERGLNSITIYKGLFKSRSDRLRFIRKCFDRVTQKRAVGKSPWLDLEPYIIDNVTGPDGSVLAADEALKMIDTICKSIAAYKSQMFLVYRNMATFQSETRAYLGSLEGEFSHQSLCGTDLHLSHYAERYWRLKRR